MLIRKTVNRRKVLRGLLGGAAVSVGVPFLECFLDDHGTALANGAPLPVRFGTWFWGLGMNATNFIPDKVGADYDLKPELEAIRSVKQHINVFSRYKVKTDGRSNLCHYTGWVLLRCGQAPTSRGNPPNESIDVTITDKIGAGMRFPSLEMAATGDKRDSFSFRSAAAINPPETSPLELYRRVFGAEFQNPNSANFQPNPKLMVRKSVLSAVREDSAELQKLLGAEDRRRMEQYFTSLRGLEQRLQMQLQKPPPAAACRAPGKEPPELPVGTDVTLVSQRHDLMTDILVMALACNQTRVFNMAYSGSFASTTRKGAPGTHHIITHEESVGPHGYQEEHSWFVRRSMESWAYFVKSLASVREGDRTLLDNTVVFAHSDHDDARIHGLGGIPMMTAGRAGGRIKTGIHFDGRHEDLASEVGFTLLQGMNLDLPAWGREAMRTSRVVKGMLV